jgi:hypothetical protein
LGEEARGRRSWKYTINYQNKIINILKLAGYPLEKNEKAKLTLQWAFSSPPLW